MLLADRDSLKGKVWVADFIFTRCGNTCPIMTSKMVELQKRITDPRVVFVSFSVDPDRDKPADLKAYAARYKADESRWRFLSPPDAKSILSVAMGMRITGPPKENNNPLLHADRFLLIDQHLKLTVPLAIDRHVGDALEAEEARPDDPPRDDREVDRRDLLRVLRLEADHQDAARRGEGLEHLRRRRDVRQRGDPSELLLHQRASVEEVRPPVEDQVDPRDPWGRVGSDRVDSLDPVQEEVLHGNRDQVLHLGGREPEALGLDLHGRRAHLRHDVDPRLVQLHRPEDQQGGRGRQHEQPEPDA